MADSSPPAPLTGPTDLEQVDGLLSRLSTQMVRARKQYYGRGPESAKSYLIDDLLFIVMRGGMTQAEQTMLDAGHHDSVRRFRQEFENEMGERLTYMIEQLTGRRVLTYQSQVLFDPNMSVEIFAPVPPARRADPVTERRDRNAATLEAVSTALVRLHKEQFGRGPTRARSNFIGDAGVTCVFYDARLPAERRMVEMGQQERARDTRTAFQAAAAEKFVAAVEEIVGRRVVAVASAADPDAGVVFENFVFAPRETDSS